MIDVTPIYDGLADHYDAMYEDPTCWDENEQVARWLDSPHRDTDTVLDIGCGTGLARDLLGMTKPENYTGLDPSQAMLDQFLDRFPGSEERVHRMAFQEYRSRERFDLVVSTFGSVSYVPADAIRRLPTFIAPGGRAFLMFYARGYLPVYERDLPTSNAVLRCASRALDMAIHLPGAHATTWHNFVVVTCGPAAAA